MKKIHRTIHLIANAHLDPVWLWDWREGLNEGITTIRTILDLMDEFEDLTFIRGESAIYQHIEKFDPVTFARMKAQIRCGRWEVVGGTFIQPDTNLAGTETLARQFTVAGGYFHSRFGRRPTVAWQADSFGHSSGLPEILHHAGMDSFAFTRPDKMALPLAEPAFWWEGDGGARILSYRPLAGNYLSERHETFDKLDLLLAEADSSQLDTMGFFYGLGNHGGGPSRRQLIEIREWTAAHPEVRVIHSGLHRMFASLRAELDSKGSDLIPTHRGELNFCLRGCYSSVAKLKFLYRRAEHLLLRTERTDSVISAFTKKPTFDLNKAWEGILFNSFHDILPGSCIERAVEDQTAWLGSVIHSTQEAEMQALHTLASQIDTRVSQPSGDHPGPVSILVWNPHPFPFQGQVEVEACLDYRIIWQYKGRANELPVFVNDSEGRPLPFQEIATEHSSVTDFPWRKRVVLPVKLPALGWNLLEMGWKTGARNPSIKNPVTAGTNQIENGLLRVEAHLGDPGPRIFHHNKSIFGKGSLEAVVFDDRWGSWGGMLEEPASLHLNTVRERWKISAVEVLELGPHRASLWVRLAGKKSRIDLTISLSQQREAVDIQARVLWDERSARLKLIMPVGDQAEFEVPGGMSSRGPAGEVPGIGWVRVNSPQSAFGFASDGIYNFDTTQGEFRATIVRATRYANDEEYAPTADRWRPSVDCGELKFRFLLAPGHTDMSRLARELEEPPNVVLVPPGQGTLPRKGSIGKLSPSTLRLVALKKAEDCKGIIVRIQVPAGKPLTAKFTWMGEKLTLGRLRGGELASWRLTRTRSGWTSERVSLSERPLAS